MVHNKTEYRLQFHLLAKDLRKQIWQENIKFRESCRSLNRADHYWSYQLTDEQCECDNDNDDEDETTLPPHKSVQSQSGKEGVPKLQELSLPSEVQRQIHQQVQLTNPEKNTSFGRDMAVQTTELGSQEQSQQNESHNEIQNVRQSLNTVTKSEEEHKMKEQQHSAVSSHRSITIQEPDSQTRVSNKAENRSETRIQPSSSRTSGLTRTSQKAYFDEKKSPFAPFGWNDSDRNVGQKKTYNVYAPETEVYTSALLALKRRRKEIERYLAEAAQKRRQQVTLDTAGVVNHSSIWMTEYQDKFTHGNKFVTDSSATRPASAPPCRKPIGWRYS
ncbi:uncharacterized protein LOC110831688 isoform X2 [Zootermopsis nevadensis]|uniref:uncharacterized protein LOC110831688 isoform X2 n=1 Tax=Zootermopsis nevadensis TaxID=136037 RepID=UPI000B8E7872|nr:uncharacterized protein LOC110831688 isoform X2 [Zootermopsis nevadensis]